MRAMKVDAPTRSIVKTLSWRVASIIITFLVSYLVTKNTSVAASISLADSIIKLVAYYYHERAWTHIRWGRKKRPKKINQQK